jgi:hypothetical protein
MATIGIDLGASNSASAVLRGERPVLRAILPAFGKTGFLRQCQATG